MFEAVITILYGIVYPVLHVNIILVLFVYTQNEIKNHLHMYNLKYKKGVRHGKHGGKVASDLGSVGVFFCVLQGYS